MEPRPLHPNVRRLWQLMAIIVTVPLVIWLIAGAWILGIPAAPLIAVVFIVTLPAVALPNVKYRRWRYAIREHDVFTARGAIWHVETLVPFDRIQFVESRQGPLDRAFQLTQVVVYTAAGRAGKIPGLDLATAESIREDLSKVAGTTSV